ncbi:hypothetical protein ACLOJK_040218 [Asimina triloba]
MQNGSGRHGSRINPDPFFTPASEQARGTPSLRCALRAKAIINQNPYSHRALSLFCIPELQIQFPQRRNRASFLAQPQKERRRSKTLTMATNQPNLECRMYEAKYPEVDQAVMIQVKNIADMGAYVSLLEYNNIEGMILFSELSRRRIRSVSSLIKVGRQEPVMVLRVDKEKGYIDLSKRRVSEEDIQGCEERYNKSKLVHSIMRHVSETMNLDLEARLLHLPTFHAFKLIVTDPDSVLNTLTREVKEIGPDGQEVTKVVPAMSEEVKDALIKNIRRRMTPQPLKIRADVEIKCFQFDGVLHIKEAMKKAEAAGNTDCPVKIKLVAPPLYVLTTQTLDKAMELAPGGQEQGMSVLNNAIKACIEEIDLHKGKLVVKEAPRAVSEKDDKLLQETMIKLNAANEEGENDEESGEEEDTGMGEIDLDNQVGITE